MELFKKKIGHINIILYICTVCCLIYYDYHGGLWLKGVTSSWFVLIGLINLFYASKLNIKAKSIYLIFTGLFLGMCADVLLGIDFMIGVLAFALGHVFYIIAFNSMEKPSVKDFVFIVPLAAFAIFMVTMTPFIQVDDSVMKILLISYAVIISFMSGKALSNLCVKKTKTRIIIGIASVLFMFSDLMLAVDMFGTPSRLTWIFCSYTYWPAQALLAVSIFFIVNELKKEGK